MQWFEGVGNIGLLLEKFVHREKVFIPHSVVSEWILRYGRGNEHNNDGKRRQEAKVLGILPYSTKRRYPWPRLAESIERVAMNCGPGVLS